MIAKDWIAEAAKELASHFSFGGGRDSYVTDEQRTNVENNYATIIRVHCPFKPDVAYMPVPRCETCAHWHGPQQHSNGRAAGVGERSAHHGVSRFRIRGQCTEPTISPEQMDEFMTLPDFGCVDWKEK